MALGFKIYTWYCFALLLLCFFPICLVSTNRFLTIELYIEYIIAAHQKDWIDIFEIKSRRTRPCFFRAEKQFCYHICLRGEVVDLNIHQPSLVPFLPLHYFSLDLNPFALPSTFLSTTHVLGLMVGCFIFYEVWMILGGWSEQLRWYLCLWKLGQWQTQAVSDSYMTTGYEVIFLVNRCLMGIKQSFHKSIHTIHTPVYMFGSCIPRSTSFVWTFGEHPV